MASRTQRVHNDRCMYLQNRNVFHFKGRSFSQSVEEVIKHSFSPWFMEASLWQGLYYSEHPESCSASTRISGILDCFFDLDRRPRRFDQDSPSTHAFTVIVFNRNTISMICQLSAVRSILDLLFMAKRRLKIKKGSITKAKVPIRYRQCCSALSGPHIIARWIVVKFREKLKTKRYSLPVFNRTRTCIGT
jgi:hypothetical protein